ncbi:DUF5688 family protein [Lachnobacterium bovis]|uniref:Uncharacterized protein n=1 Tax=Lachnobacterium bovis DSM 14045 TaxID=1122142 RepID=A0A1H3F1D1_9FIRM|nr:DUF5688 family protein [Lachnobacterium bovis]SDX84826.1 hypothetical protein SAMN02910414_00098 [Lachnobacterium bovis DSM 14045]
MTYDNFKSDVLIELKKHFEGEASITIKSFIKNNGKKLDGIIISTNDSNISPTIYLNPLYHRYLEGLPIKEIVREIIQINNSNKVYKGFDTNQFLDFDEAKNHIFFKLVNYERNKELLQDLPHMKFLDLAVVFGFFVESDNSDFASILIHNSHLNYWEINTDDLYKIALYNTPNLFSHKISNLFDTVISLSEKISPGSLNELDFSELDFEKTKSNNNFFILTNKYGINGASCILYRGLLKKIAKEKNTNLIVIPSSIHEGATCFAI